MFEIIQLHEKVVHNAMYIYIYNYTVYCLILLLLSRFCLSYKTNIFQKGLPLPGTVGKMFLNDRKLDTKALEDM